MLIYYYFDELITSSIIVVVVAKKIARGEKTTVRNHCILVLTTKNVDCYFERINKYSA